MGLKFDGRYLKDGGKTLANVYRDALKEGSSSAGRTLGNLYRDIVKEGSSSSGKSLCNVSRGDIREGSSSGGRKLISLKDAAKKSWIFCSGTICCISMVVLWKIDFI